VVERQLLRVIIVIPGDHRFFHDVIELFFTKDFFDHGVKGKSSCVCEKESDVKASKTSFCFLNYETNDTQKLTYTRKHTFGHKYHQQSIF
jgi:hypothetical protein